LSSTAAAPAVAGSSPAHRSAATAAGTAQSLVFGRIWAATVAHREAALAGLQ
jgi:hypothetical protein